MQKDNKNINKNKSKEKMQNIYRQRDFKDNIAKNDILKNEEKKTKILKKLKHSFIQEKNENQ